MKILFVLEQNEASRYYYSVFCWLVQNTQVQIYVYNIGRSDGFKKQIEPIIGAGRYFQFKSKKSYLYSIPDITKCLKLVKPDIVHAHMFHCSFYAACAILYSGNFFNLIYHRHNIEVGSFKENLMDHFTLRKAKKVIFVSQAAVDYATKKWPKFKNKFVCIYNGIDVPEKHAANTIDLPERYILLLARLRQKKGHILAINAFKIVQQSFPNIKMVFAGDGPYKNTIAGYLEKNELQESILLIGHTEDIGCVIDNAQFMIVPSEYEAFGLVAAEGMALKKMVIAANIGGLKEVVVNTQTGILVDSKATADWSKIIEHYLLFPEEATKLGEAGYEYYLKHFTSEIMVKNYFALYTAVLNYNYEC